MTDKELMEQALNLLRQITYRQNLMAAHHAAVESALEARINDIKTEADYEAAMAALDALMDLDPAPGTLEYDRLDLLATRLEQYEVKIMAEQKFGKDAQDDE